MAAPVYDNSASTFSGANVASLTTASWAIGGSDRYLVAGIGSGAATPVDPTEMRWGGSAGTLLTKFGTTQSLGANWKLSAYGLLAPTAQTSTLYGLWPSTQDETAISGVSATGVDQTTPTGTVATAAGTDTAPTVAVTTAADDFVVDVIWFGDSSGASRTLTVGAGQTSRQEIEGANLVYEGMGMSTEVATGTSTTMSWTISGAVDNWGIQGIPLKPVAAGGADVRNHIIPAYTRIHA